MPQGHFNIKLLHAGGLTDEDFEIAKKNGTIDDLLNGLKVKKEFDQHNQLSHYVAGEMFVKIFGAPSVAVGVSIQNGNFFHYIGFGNGTSEYDYSYAEYNTYMLNLFVSPNGNSANTDIKTTYAAIRTHMVVVEDDSTGFRAAHDIHRFLWTPSQLISNELREVKYVSTDSEGASNWDYDDECRTHSRVRIKDANGNPQTITKTAEDVLLVQWTLTLKSI